MDVNANAMDVQPLKLEPLTIPINALCSGWDYEFGEKRFIDTNCNEWRWEMAAAAAVGRLFVAARKCRMHVDAVNGNVLFSLLLRSHIFH